MPNQISNFTFAISRCWPLMFLCGTLVGGCSAAPPSLEEKFKAHVRENIAYLRTTFPKATSNLSEKEANALAIEVLKHGDQSDFMSELPAEDKVLFDQMAEANWKFDNLLHYIAGIKLRKDFGAGRPETEAEVEAEIAKGLQECRAATDATEAMLNASSSESGGGTEKSQE